ncbi:MAG: dienelactone hydrolase family protein, partial [Chloroflexi bacterium]|nr:dienelactone hydrolase family protein [Chloroflexota bacterium]
EQAARAQIIVFPDVRGLHQFYKDLALRFAQVGVRALALDYFARTAPTNARDESFEFMPHVQQMTFPNFMRDVRAGVSELNRDQKNRATFTVGFCRGGTLSLLVGAQNLALNGIIAFYSGFSRPITDAEGPTLEQAHKIRFPVLGLYGGEDQSIPASDIGKLDEELDVAKVEHELRIYPGAPHSFFDRKMTEFANESADAWTRVLNFIHAHSGK